MKNLFDGWHFVILAVVIVLLFGAKRLPDAARSLGRSMRILKTEVRTMRDDDVPGRADPTAPQPTTEARQLDAQPTPATIVDPVQRVSDK